MATADLPEVHPADEASMQVIRDAAAFKTRPIEELLEMAYAFGRTRGTLEGIEKVGTALAEVAAAGAPILLKAGHA